MICAERAKKCARSCQLTSWVLTRRQIGLMDERRALQRQARAFVPHVPPGLDSQLRVDQRRELLECPLVSLAPCLQQARYVDGLGRGHATV